MALAQMNETYLQDLVLGDTPESTLPLSEVVGVLRDGFPYEWLEKAADRLGVSRTSLAVLLGVPERTLARRKREGKLRPGESDRLFRLFRIVFRAEEVFGEPERAHRWLRKPNRVLDGEAPINLLDTDFGAKQVETVLGRIEHGVVS